MFLLVSFGIAEWNWGSNPAFAFFLVKRTIDRFMFLDLKSEVEKWFVFVFIQFPNWWRGGLGECVVDNDCFVFASGENKSVV